MKKEMICIVCPIGCHLEIKKDGDEFKVTGNQCKRGPVYAKKELTNPTRIITSTVSIRNAIHNVIPVKTDGEIPKNLVKEVMDEINKIEVSSPIDVGEVIKENIMNTGVNLIVTRSM